MAINPYEYTSDQPHQSVPTAIRISSLALGILWAKIWFIELTTWVVNAPRLPLIANIILGGLVLHSSIMAILSFRELTRT